MPMGIVTQTCPAPECNLTEKELEQFLEELTNYVNEFEPAFERVEQLAWSRTYVQGLLGDASRKNVEQMALELGKNVRSMQHFIGQSGWKVEPVMTVYQGVVADTLGEVDGVALIDESGGGQARGRVGGGGRAILWIGGQSREQPGGGLPGLCQS